MPETTKPIILDGPFGVPLTTEPETGYITRGLTTYAVDYADMTVAQALDLGVILPGFWRSLYGARARVWSARVNDGPIAYGPTKEAAIHAANGPTRRRSTTLEFLLTQGPPTLTWDRMGFLVGVDPARGADKSVVVVNERHKDHERKALRALAMRDLADFQRKTGTTVHNASLDMISSWVLATGKAEELRALIAEIEKAEQPKTEDKVPSPSWWPIGGFPSPLLWRMSSLGRALLDAESVGETGRTTTLFRPSDLEKKALRTMAERYPEEVTKCHGKPGEVPSHVIAKWLFENKARWEEYCVALNDLRRSREGQRPRRIRVVGTTLLGGAQPSNPNEARAHKILTALKGNTKVVTEAGNDDLYAALAVGWAEQHPTGRVIVAAKRKALARIFDPSPNGGALAARVGVRSSTTTAWGSPTTRRVCILSTARPTGRPRGSSASGCGTPPPARTSPG